MISIAKAIAAWARHQLEEEERRRELEQRVTRLEDSQDYPKSIKDDIITGDRVFVQVTYKGTNDDGEPIVEMRNPQGKEYRIVPHWFDLRRL